MSDENDITVDVTVSEPDNADVTVEATVAVSVAGDVVAVDEATNDPCVIGCTECDWAAVETKAEENALNFLVCPDCDGRVARLNYALWCEDCDWAAQCEDAEDGDSTVLLPPEGEEGFDTCPDCDGTLREWIDD